jgi:phosphate transport system permease protein
MQKGMFKKEYAWRGLVVLCGVAVIFITTAIGAFLIYKGTDTFTVFRHSLTEFLFSQDFHPNDAMTGPNGTVGAAIFIVGSLSTCGLAILISTPFSLASAIFVSEISPRFGDMLFRPAVDIFVGIPSIVYGWTGLTVLVPFIRDLFHLPYGNNIFTAGLVLSVMIFPTITSVSIDALRAVPKELRDAAYGMGCTRWQVISRVVQPAAAAGIFTGIILGLARAFGEALAVAMVIGKSRTMISGIFSATSSLTTVIASNMGNTFDGTEYNSALWTMALLLFLISLLFIFAIHAVSKRGERKLSGKD